MTVCDNSTRSDDQKFSQLLLDFSHLLLDFLNYFWMLTGVAV